MKIKILIVGQNHLLCNVVRHLLEKEQHMEAVCFTTVQSAAAYLEKNDGDIVLVHSERGKKEALPTVQFLASHYPELKVMVIDLPQKREDILPYLEGGAAGYILCKDSVEEMMAKIIAVYEGQPIIGPDVAAAIIDRLAEWATHHRSPVTVQMSLSDLTRRENEVLELLGENLSNQEIAEKLVIEVGTVKNHVHRILKKLNVRNRIAAAAYLPVMQT